MHIQTKLDLACHVVAAMAGTCAVCALYHDYWYAVIFIAGCIFIDLDHLIDYFMHYRGPFRLGIFVRHLYVDGGKVYLFWHAWEIVLLLAVCSWALDSAAAGIFAVSLAVHLFIDNVQRRRPLFYFLVYRIMHRFDARYLLPEYFELRGGVPAGGRICA